MYELVKKFEEEKERMNNEAKKYPTGDWRNMYYIGCALGLVKAITELQKQNGGN